MELVYLWVEKYKNIENQGFNFSPRFTCSYDEEKQELTIDKKDDYASIFPPNINVTAIVGENGSGKSSLLNFIIEQNESFGIFVFKSEDRFLIFSKNRINEISTIKSDFKYELNPAYFHKHHTSLLFLRSYMDINTYDIKEQLTIPRRFFQFSEKRDFISDLHKNTTELFNIVLINTKKDIHDSFETDPYSTLALNQHFTYLKDKYLHKILKYYPDLEKFIGQYFKVDKVTYELKDLGNIFLASPSFKDNYKNDNFLSAMFEIFNKEKSTENRIKILCLIFSYLYKEEIRSIILKNQDHANYIELYSLLIEQQHRYVIVWNSFLKVMNEKVNFKTIITEYLAFIKEIRHEILEFTFTPSLSSGEEKLLYLFVNIYDYVLYMKGIGKTKFTIIIDEPDTLLHPNWQRKLIFLLETFINKFFKDDIFNFIITSHSPFILSDLPKENVIFLEKYEDKDDEVKNENQIIGNCKNVTKETNIDTFGANIHTLLSHGFFMKEGLMGEFAKEKIQNVINFLNNKESKIQSKEEAWKIIQVIGEPFLKYKLEEKFHENYSSDKVKNEAKIKRLEEEIERLKSVKPKG